MTSSLCLIFSWISLLADPAASVQLGNEKLQAFHLQEASKWQMFLDEAHKTRAEFNSKPIYIWSNPTRSGGQHGSVFVWTQHGRPVAIGSTFSHPENNARMLCHEFHSLAQTSLFPDRETSDQSWTPQAAVILEELPDAPSPETSAARRLIQMRTLSRQFSAHSIDFRKERWELRLLSQPLYRYESAAQGVIDGALFAFVTSAGTDPEVVLVLEARGKGTNSTWFFRTIRFSDSNLYVQHNGKEVWSSVRDERHQLHFNPDHTYRLIRDRSIEEFPELVTEK